MQKKIGPLLLITSLVLLHACSNPGPGLFGKKTPHEQYEKKIKDAGLKENPLGEAWLKAAAITLSAPLDVSIPYSETGYVSRDRASGVGLRFRAKRGQRLRIALVKNVSSHFGLYVDLWEPYPPEANRSPKFISAADTVSLLLEHLVTEDTAFILRIQPELLKDGEYALTISAGPSLGFPISPKVKSNIGSFWGAGRDNGDRKHEGIDIFAPVHSDAVASADGTVTRVNENALGGKVIFLRPDNASYSLYYAHLDSQLVHEGQRVRAGEVIGLTGNTGNARFTASHLHFGIYTNSGAIDPLYFVKNDYKDPPRSNVPATNLNTWMRTGKGAKLYASPAGANNMNLLLDEGTPVHTDAACGNYYRVSLPDGSKGFMTASTLIALNKSLKKITVKKPQPLLASPDSTALVKKYIVTGDKINVLATFRDFYFINDATTEGWVSKKIL